MSDRFFGVVLCGFIRIVRLWDGCEYFSFVVGWVFVDLVFLFFVNNVDE